MRNCIVVDRGHRHVSTGCSELCIWFSPRQNGGIGSGPNYPDIGDDNDDDKDGSGHGGSRLHRGRSPPSGAAGDHHWHGSDSADPWANYSSTYTSPPRKAPRRQAAVPSATYSIKPDPPLMRPHVLGRDPPKIAIGTDGHFVLSIENQQVAHHADASHLSDYIANKVEEPWHSLAGMARHTVYAGATIINCGMHSGVEYEGVSLLTHLLAKSESTNIIIREINTVSGRAQPLPPHTFSVGDDVYYKLVPAPYIIKRIGYGCYLEEVRITHFGDRNSHEAGIWVHHSMLYLPDIGDSL